MLFAAFLPEEALIRTMVFIVVVGIVAGVLIWATQSVRQLDPDIKQLIRVGIIVCAVIAVVLLLLRLV